MLKEDGWCRLLFRRKCVPKEARKETQKSITWRQTRGPKNSYSSLFGTAILLFSLVDHVWTVFSKTSAPSTIFKILSRNRLKRTGTGDRVTSKLAAFFAYHSIFVFPSSIGRRKLIRQKFSSQSPARERVETIVVLPSCRRQFRLQLWSQSRKTNDPIIFTTSRNVILIQLPSPWPLGNFPWLVFFTIY